SARSSALFTSSSAWNREGRSGSASGFGCAKRRGVKKYVVCQDSIVGLLLPHQRTRRPPRSIGKECANDRDRGAPHDAAPPTPPGIRVTYRGGSIGLSFSMCSRAFEFCHRQDRFGRSAAVRS